MHRKLAVVGVMLVAFASQPVVASGFAAARSPSDPLPDAPALVAASGFTTPVLYKQAGEHERMFIAIFDCSWKNAKNGPKEPTIVHQFYDQLLAADGSSSGQVHAEYELTDCALDNWYTHRDRGQKVFDARLAEMYRRLGSQSATWLQQDPAAEIRVVEVGGSWGALQASAFAHVVDRHGIRRVASGNDGDGYAGESLIEAGKTAQAVVLLDPVGTSSDDVRLPPSVISGFQLTAADEHRPSFQSDPLIPDGISPEGRFFGATVAGSHSDICGGYALNGLSIRAANLAVDYINGLSDRPLLQKQPEPDDPHVNVIHRSEDEGR